MPILGVISSGYNSPPAAPTNLFAAGDAILYDDVTLSWTAPAGTITGYKVYLDGNAVQSGGSDLILNSNATSYNFASIEWDTTYILGVRAINVIGEGVIATISFANGNPNTGGGGA